MNMKVYLLILMLNLLCPNLSNGFKCSIQERPIRECTVLPDSTNRRGANAIGRDSNSIQAVNFNGNKNDILELTQSEFPFCRQFTNLENCYIYKINSIEVNIFDDCENVDVIWIIDTEITEIPHNLFSYPNLVELKLEGNKFTTLPESVFKDQHNLEVLSLYMNQISSLPSTIFQPLHKLTWLSISTNDLDYLDANWFSSLNNLKNLDLSNNLIMNLPSNVFKNLRNLEQLQLYDNSLTAIHSDSFGIHDNLRILRFTNNPINSIDPKLTNKIEKANIFMKGNVCCQNDISLSKDERQVNQKLRICHRNYQERSPQEEFPQRHISCGKRAVLQPHILNGNITEIGEYPWNVALIHNNKNTFFCGGTLVSKKFVVTAAHCMNSKLDVHNLTVQDFFILIDVYNISMYNSENKVAVKRIIIHPDWNTNVVIYDADIAVLELVNEVTNIPPICLANEQSMVGRATKGTVVGFGMTETGFTTNIAKKLEIPIYEYHNCTRYVEDLLRFRTSARTFCGGPGDGRGVCDGDSGSGVFVYRNDIFYLKGMVSTSLVTGELNQCNVFTQAIFTDVTRYYDWIKGIIKDSY